MWLAAFAPACRVVWLASGSQRFPLLVSLHVVLSSPGRQPACTMLRKVTACRPVCVARTNEDQRVMIILVIIINDVDATRSCSESRSCGYFFDARQSEAQRQRGASVICAVERVELGFRKRASALGQCVPPMRRRVSSTIRLGTPDERRNKVPSTTGVPTPTGLLGALATLYLPPRHHHHHHSLYPWFVQLLSISSDPRSAFGFPATMASVNVMEATPTAPSAPLPLSTSINTSPNLPVASSVPSMASTELNPETYSHLVDPSSMPPPAPLSPQASAAVSAAAAAASVLPPPEPRYPYDNEYSIFVGDLAPTLREEDLVAQFIHPPPWPPRHPLVLRMQQHRMLDGQIRCAPAPFQSTKGAKVRCSLPYSSYFALTTCSRC